MTLLKRAGNSACRKDGTGPAILYKSGGTCSPAQRFNSWGGPRNSASRRSDHLTPLQAVEFVEAAQNAIAIGKPFNRHLTVHWTKARLAENEAAAATGRMVKLIRDWSRKSGGTVLYAWIRETGPGKGTHSHILMHVPLGMKLHRTRSWYKQAARLQGSVPKRCVRSECIGASAQSASGGSEDYLANVTRLVAYLLKGCDPVTAAELGLERWSEGGRIIGKRVSISRPR